MATTADDIANVLVMAMFEIVEAEYEEEFGKDGIICPEEYPHLEDIRYPMCERFASGYQPKDATEFVSDLVARLAGLR
jgi:hypothetical protein